MLLECDGEVGDKFCTCHGEATGKLLLWNLAFSGYCVCIFTDWDRIATILLTNDYPAQHQLSDVILHYIHIQTFDLGFNAGHKYKI